MNFDILDRIKTGKVRLAQATRNATGTTTVIAAPGAGLKIVIIGGFLHSEGDAVVFALSETTSGDALTPTFTESATTNQMHIDLPMIPVAENDGVDLDVTITADEVYCMLNYVVVKA